MASSVPFSLSKRRSNSSPQLQCEATDFSSLTGTSNAAGNPASSWSAENKSAVRTVDRTHRRTVKILSITEASVHWLEPKQRAVLHDVPVVKPECASALHQADAASCSNQGMEGAAAQLKSDSDLLRCNETIHYLQGSDTDSDSASPGVPRRKSHACTQKQKSDGRQTFKRLSKAACHIFSKLTMQEAKYLKGKGKRKEVNKSEDDSDEDDIQPITRRRSRSLTSRMMKRFGQRDEDGNPKTDTAQTTTLPASANVKQKSKQSKKAGGKNAASRKRASRHTPLVNFAKFDPSKYPIECSEEIERAVREREIEEGIAAVSVSAPVSPDAAVADTRMFIHPGAVPENVLPSIEGAIGETSDTTNYPLLDAPTLTTENIFDWYGSLTPSGTFIPRTIHTQIDYVHCLVPDQWTIMKSPFYWGKIDRYEADDLLDNKPEGTFLLRDSAQEEFLFSVSFCRYGRTLHARIEQWNHKFSFDAHDPGVYSSDTICGLLEHYKDPNYCMFFEPMLTNPLPRVNPSSLLELGRASICQHVSYDTICYLKLPNKLKEYLREYHYKQRVRTRRVEVDMPQLPEVAPSVVTNTCISR